MYHGLYSWDWVRADQHLSRALELEPGSAHIHDAVGWYRTTVGQFDEAEIHLKRAIELDPLSFTAMTELGTLFACENRPEDAIHQFQNVIALNPQFLNAPTNLAKLLADMGHFQEAQEVVDRERQYNYASQYLDAYIQARRGDRPAALQLIDKVKRDDSGKAMSPFGAARFYMALGDTDEAIGQLRQAYDERNSYFVFSMCADRTFLPLRGDPRFIALKKKIGK